MSDASTGELPIAPAATVLVLREAAPGLELLLVQRARGLAFHGGAWVFPGGRVDPSEMSADELASARRAAVRETREEAGLSFELSALVPFAHWTTPRGLARRFATWFFAASLDTPADVVVDGAEIHSHRWFRPEDALSAQARGEIELPPPTFVTVSLLREFASADAVLARFRASEPCTYVPRLCRTPLGELALYHGDVAYDGGELEQPGPRHRLLMCQGGWRYERPGALG